MILIPAGFHRFRFQPSTHIAPKLRRDTVPSPSPSLTPFRTCDEVIIRRNHSPLLQVGADLRIRAFVRVLSIDPAAGERYVPRRVKVMIGTSVFLRAYLNIHCLANVLVFIGLRVVPISRQTVHADARRTAISSYSPV